MYHSALHLEPNNIQFTVMWYRQKQQINTLVKLFAILIPKEVMERKTLWMSLRINWLIGST